MFYYCCVQVCVSTHSILLIFESYAFDDICWMYAQSNQPDLYPWRIFCGSLSLLHSMALFTVGSFDKIIFCLFKLVSIDFDPSLHSRVFWISTFLFAIKFWMNGFSFTEMPLFHTWCETQVFALCHPSCFHVLLWQNILCIVWLGGRMPWICSYHVCTFS